MKKVIAVILALVAIALGLFLPMAVSNYKDKELNSNVENIEDISEQIETAKAKELSIVDKLRIIAGSYTEYVGIDRGNNMTSEQAIQEVTDFSLLFNNFMFTDEELKEIAETAEASVLLATDSKGAGESFVCWYVLITLDDSVVGFYVDDETGLVLQIAVATNEQIEIPDIEYAAQEIYQIARGLAGYYKLSFIGIDYPSDDNPNEWIMNYETEGEYCEIVFSFNNYGFTINDFNDNSSDDAEISIY